MKNKMAYLTSWKAIYSILTAMVVLIGGYIASYETAPPADYVVGAVPGSEIQGNDFIVGQSKFFIRGTDFIATSTNVCSILTPAATTTLISASMEARTGVSGVIEFGIANGATNWATTTLLAAERVADGAVTTLSATSSAAAGSGYDGSFAPSSYINFFHKGGAGSITSGVRGRCNVFLQVQ